MVFATRHRSFYGALTSRVLWKLWAILFIYVIYQMLSQDKLIVPLFTIFHRHMPKLETIKYENFTNNTNNYTSLTPVCRIKNFDPLSEIVQKFIKVPSPEPKCEDKKFQVEGGRLQQGPPLVIVHQKHSLLIDSHALTSYNLSSTQQIACCYRTITRLQESPTNYSKNADNREMYSSKCRPFNKGDRHNFCESDLEAMIRVQCFSTTLKSRDAENSTHAQRKKNLNIEVYRDFFTFVPAVKKSKSTPRKKLADQVSVLALGMDAMSRLAFLREMPRLHKVLTNPPYSSASMLGYNTVGENTYPNMVPMLTGLKQEDLNTTCNVLTPKHCLDTCPFLWREFSERGYYTAFVEDAPSIAIFNYLKTGFVEQPTDYYTRPLFRRAEKEIGHSGPTYSRLCLGARLAIEKTVDFLSKFVERFFDDRYFGFFFLTSLTHNSMTLARHGEKLFVDLFQSLAERDLFNNTVVLVFSDHGYRFDGFRETTQGKSEFKLPMAYWSLPRLFRQRFPEATHNLHANTQRLTTAFDIHATLRDLRDPVTYLESNALRERFMCQNDKDNGKEMSKICAKWTENHPDRDGRSLFLPVPITRNCRQAGIPQHFCACQEPTPIPLESATNVANYVVDHLNSLMLTHPECSTLTLEKIREPALLLEPGESQQEQQVDCETIEIILQTVPGKGVFEATVRRCGYSKTLMGPVVRLNLYLNQSRCVDDLNLKSFCYCT